MHHKICAAEHLVNNHDVGTFKPYPQTLYCADSIPLPTYTSALSLTARTFTILVLTPFPSLFTHQHSHSPLELSPSSDTPIPSLLTHQHSHSPLELSPSSDTPIPSLFTHQHSHSPLELSPSSDTPLCCVPFCEACHRWSVAESSPDVLSSSSFFSSFHQTSPGLGVRT